ncbi:hypothetical protein NDU88_002989 [Pleurodeles waltl]|uniref:Uncharacterized protein n=1 Tax=Pleurodeles waltl TaxID=8319 RepID=A0AAV7M9S3_PLEWA|nr:hypothetical protein NDU88_002989 [Pleurodeles waltl]
MEGARGVVLAAAWKSSLTRHAGADAWIKGGRSPLLCSLWCAKAARRPPCERRRCSHEGAAHILRGERWWVRVARCRRWCTPLALEVDVPPMVDSPHHDEMDEEDHRFLRSWRRIPLALRQSVEGWSQPVLILCPKHMRKSCLSAVETGLAPLFFGPDF